MCVQGVRTCLPSLRPTTLCGVTQGSVPQVLRNSEAHTQSLCARRRTGHGGEAAVVAAVWPFVIPCCIRIVPSCQLYGSLAEEATRRYSYACYIAGENALLPRVDSTMDLKGGLSHSDGSKRKPCPAPQKDIINFEP